MELKVIVSLPPEALIERGPGIHSMELKALTSTLALGLRHMAPNPFNGIESMLIEMLTLQQPWESIQWN